MSGAHKDANQTVKTVILVEDNDDDIFFIKKACAAAGVPHTLVVIQNGQAALNYLSGALESHPSALPDLVILDIKLPGVNGDEVLKWLRSEPKLKYLPVIVLTGSILKRDLATAYSSGATSYFHKQSVPAELGLLIKTVLEYWLRLNTIPPFISKPSAPGSADHEAV